MRRAKFFYAIYFAAGAALIPFLALYYQSLGLTGTQIGLLTGIVPLVTLVSSTIWGAVADATRRYRAVMLVAIVGLWLSILAMSLADSLGQLLPLVVLFAFFGAPIAPIIDNSVVTLLGDQREEYGRVRLWGSVGWGIAALIIGPILQRAGLIWAFYADLILLAVLFVSALRVPLVCSERLASYRAGLRVLLGNGRFLLLLFVALLFGAGIATLLSYLFLYMAELGASETLMALTLTVATISEIPFLFISGRLIRRYGADRIIAASVLLMAGRAFAFAWMPAPWWVIVINLFQGPTFATFWAAAVSQANRLAPAGLGATAQGALGGAMFGLGSAAGSFLGGVGYERYGAPTLYQATAWLLVLTFIVFVVAHRLPRLAPAGDPAGT